MRNLVILGASGSIGQSTLKVLRQNPGRWQVLALTAARSVDAMVRDCLEFSPRFAVMVDEKAASDLAGRLKTHGCATQVLCGQAALCEVAAHPDATASWRPSSVRRVWHPPWPPCVPASGSCWPTRRPW